MEGLAKMPRIKLPKCGHCGYPFVPWMHGSGVRISKDCRECWRLLANWEERMQRKAQEERR